MLRYLIIFLFIAILIPDGFAREIELAFDLEVAEAKSGTIEFHQSAQLLNIPGREEIPYKVITVFAHPKDIHVSIDYGKELVLYNKRAKLNNIKRFKCGRDIFIEGYDKNYYSRKRTALYEIQGIGDFRGTPVSRVMVYPISYDQQENITYFYPNISFKVSSKKDQNIAFNYDHMKRRMNNRYLIVTPEKFLESFNEYIDYKTEGGYEVNIMTLEELGRDFYEVKKSLEKLYHSDRSTFSYILLVGHENMFPTEYIATSSNPNTPSDLNYFTFGGEKDIIPDVFYSRLTIRDTIDIEKQLYKFMEFEYEQKYSNVIIGISSNEGDNPTDQELMDEIIYSLEEFYNVFKFNQSSPRTTANNLVKMFEDNLKWIFYLGHGTGTSWSSFNNGSFNFLHMRKLKENKNKPILIDISCSNGRYSINRFGERFLNASSRSSSSTGIVSYLGGSDRISWMAPAMLGQGISRAADFSDTLGEAIFKGKLHLLNNYSDLSEIRDTFAWFALQGDPTLNINGH